MTISFEDFQEAHSNYSSTGAYREDSWRPVIDILEKEGWTPYEYLDYVFREFRKPLVPSLLMSEKIVDMYREERDNRRALNHRRAEWAMDQVQTRLRNNMTIADILDDKELQGHTLFLYLIAATDKNQKAMDLLRDLAIYEIKTMPELKDIYSAKFDRRLFPC